VREGACADRRSERLSVGHGAWSSAAMPVSAGILHAAGRQYGFDGQKTPAVQASCHV